MTTNTTRTHTDPSTGQTVEYWVPTSALVAGDRVITGPEGLATLEGQPQTYPGHAGMTVYSWVGRTPSGAEWIVQGNDLASWAREVR